MDIGFLKESQQISHVLIAKAAAKMLKDVEMQYVFSISVSAMA
ncbi:MAG: hypothetical protein RMY28_006885 [Nostoc sp. ChiSLP01]|nr:hypothetical protein [Nostoc sp. CmiSLP01]MDZ8282082.1 hypothetical protein [Nostoc sp. ChiSLP01]